MWRHLRPVVRDERGKVRHLALSIAAAAFVLLTVILIAVGLRVGVSLVELIPTTAMEAAVIAGLFVVATLPVEEPPPRHDDGGDPLPETPPQRPLGQALSWLSLLDRDFGDLPAEEAPPLTTASLPPR